MINWINDEPTESGYYFVEYMRTPPHAVFNAPKTMRAVMLVHLVIFYSSRTIWLLPSHFCVNSVTKGEIEKLGIVRWSERIPEPTL